jgi:hypothetical protein
MFATGVTISGDFPTIGFPTMGKAAEWCQKEAGKPITVTLDEWRVSMTFPTLEKAAEWCHDFDLIGTLFDESSSRVFLYHGHHLRSKWGDDKFPPQVLREMRVVEAKLNLPEAIIEVEPPRKKRRVTVVKVEPKNEDEAIPPCPRCGKFHHW